MTSITFETGLAPRGFDTRQRDPRPLGVAPARPAVHLTRRGRLLVFVLAMAFVLGVGMWVFGATSAATQHAQPTRVVVVGSGETLWDIADDLAPSGDIGDTVARIERLNHLDSGMVMAGQRLLVPVGE